MATRLSPRVCFRIHSGAPPNSGVCSLNWIKIEVFRINIKRKLAVYVVYLAKNALKYDAWGLLAWKFSKVQHPILNSLVPFPWQPSLLCCFGPYPLLPLNLAACPGATLYSKRSFAQPVGEVGTLPLTITECFNCHWRCLLNFTVSNYCCCYILLLYSEYRSVYLFSGSSLYVYVSLGLHIKHCRYLEQINK